ncbi:MAG: Gfo/Idh/MocA family oxidoreductase [Chloroflexi bacterium]|nr:Gfo/Idh/MocA family oxidoreductase [Chloroflexota bacterium]
MGDIILPVIIHGVTGRMGRIALRALQRIAQEGSLHLDADVVRPVGIGVSRSQAALEDLSREAGLEHYSTDLRAAVEQARRLNPEHQMYHNTVATGIRRQVLADALPLLDPQTTAVFMEKPLAPHYADGRAIVAALEEGGFRHGVVHQFLTTPGVSMALELIPRIRPLSAQMLFGYEVGPGLDGNPEFSGQRPDFNWTLAAAGGGIILDMSHEGYLSEALFGETESLSAVARLVVPQRMSTDGHTVIDCDVEDYAALRRQHVGGVVNTSVWSWYRRVNSEFGPLEITVDGELGSMVFGLYGLKVQWRETAPANRWERSVSGAKVEWRDHWEYVSLLDRDPFAIELGDYVLAVLTGSPYPKDAIHALNLLGQVEAFYTSAAQDGREIPASEFLRYPAEPPAGWRPERLQGVLRGVR